MDASTRIENFPGHDGLSLALEHFDATNERSNRNHMIYTHRRKQSTHFYTAIGQHWRHT